jgi:hypothetical protein
MPTVNGEFYDTCSGTLRDLLAGRTPTPGRRGARARENDGCGHPWCFAEAQRYVNDVRSGRITAAPDYPVPNLEPTVLTLQFVTPEQCPPDLRPSAYPYWLRADIENDASVYHLRVTGPRTLRNHHLRSATEFPEYVIVVDRGTPYSWGPFAWAPRPATDLFGGRYLDEYTEFKAAFEALRAGRHSSATTTVTLAAAQVSGYYCAGCLERHATEVPACGNCGWCATKCAAEARCYDCAPCGRRHRSDSRPRCATCNACTDSHRNGRTCFNCATFLHEATDDNFCVDCNRCSRCRCNCRGNACDIQFVSNPVDLELWRASSFKLNRSHRMASGELEVAKGGDKRVDEVVSRWGMTVKTDGSVPDGVEINSAPANGDHLVNQLTELTRSLVESDAAADSSCGYHLHVDTRDYRWEDMRKALLAWAHIEDEAFRLVPESRRDSDYCNRRAEQVKRYLNFDPALSHGQIKQAVMLVVSDGRAVPYAGRGNGVEIDTPPLPPRCGEYSEDYHSLAREYTESEWTRQYGPRPLENECGNQFNYRVKLDAYKKITESKRYFHPQIVKGTCPTRPNKNGKRRRGRNQVGGDRYYAFNVQSWFSHGTVEIRLHHGTVNRDKVVNWALLWCSFFDWCKVATLKDIERFCSLDPWAALLSVAPSEEVRAWMSARRRKFNDFDSDEDTAVRESDDTLALNIGAPLPVRNWRRSAETLRSFKAEDRREAEVPQRENTLTVSESGVEYADFPF